MELIYDHVWKGQRETRKNRSFIREFWRYADSCGDDNYVTFHREEKTKINTRGNNIK